MRKIIALFTVLFCFYTAAHAFTQQDTLEQMQYATLNTSTTDGEDQNATPSNNKDNEAVGEGSGDDVDTANEADPKNDKDPEADKAPEAGKVPTSN